jgi:hypothetical protein
VEEAVMVSLPEELATREAAARRRVEELQVGVAELTARLVEAREALSRLTITRETVGQVLSELATRSPGVSGAYSGAGAVPQAGASPGVARERGARVPRSAAGRVVPPWRAGLDAGVLPGLYRDLVEVVMDAPGPVQAKQIVPRVGLPATTAKIEGTRGKLKRLVERGWLLEVEPGMFTAARTGPQHGTSAQTGRVSGAPRS